MLLTIGLTLGAVFYARPAMLRASTPTNLNGGTVATVPVSNSSGTDWTDVAAAVSPAVVTIQAQGARPQEIGSGAAGGENVPMKTHWSRAEVEDMRRRAARGERVIP